ncbi:MAG: hypothetical protein ABIF09_05080 [Gemmatimonadota bacterium]
MPLSSPTIRAQAGFLTLLLLGVGTGMPHEFAAEHEGGEIHIGLPDHGHSAQLLELDDRLHNTPSPGAIASVAVGWTGEPTPTVLDRWVPQDILVPRSRPPPNASPRAPPHLLISA